MEVKSVSLPLHQYTPLHLAADGGQVDTVRSLVDKGADTNVRDSNHDVSEWEYTADCWLLLVIGFVRNEDIESGEGVDVTIHMITHGLVIETFTWPIAGMCWDSPRKSNMYKQNEK